MSDTSPHHRDNKSKFNDADKTSHDSSQKDFSSNKASDTLFVGQDKDALSSLDQVPNTSQRSSVDEVRLQGEVRHGPTINPIDPAISDKAGVSDQTFKSDTSSSFSSTIPSSSSTTQGIPLPKSVDDLISQGKLPDDYDDNENESVDEYQVKDISDLPLENLKIINTGTLRQEEKASDVTTPSSVPVEQQNRGLTQQVRDTAVGLAHKAIASVQGVVPRDVSGNDIPLPKSVDDLISQGKLPDDYDDNEAENKDEYQVKDISDLPLENLKIINTGALRQEENASDVTTSSSVPVERQSRGVVQKLRDTAVGLAHKAIASVQGVVPQNVGGNDIPLPKSVDDLTSQGKLPDDYDDNEAENKDEYQVKDISDLPLENLKIINTGSLSHSTDVSATSVEVPEDQHNRGVTQKIKDTAFGLAQRAIASVHIASERVKETALEALHKVQEMDQRAKETLDIASHKTNEKLNDITVKTEDFGAVTDQEETPSTSSTTAFPAGGQQHGIHSVKAQHVSQSGTESSAPSFSDKVKEYASEASIKAQELGQKAQLKAQDLSQQAQIKTQDINQSLSEQAAQVKAVGSNTLAEAAHNFVSKAKEYDQQLQRDLQAQGQTLKQDENLPYFTMKQDLPQTQATSQDKDVSDFPKEQDKDVSDFPKKQDKDVSDFSKKQDWESKNTSEDTNIQTSSTPSSTERTGSRKSEGVEDISQKMHQYADKAKHTASEWKEQAKEKAQEMSNEAAWKVSEKLDQASADVEVSGRTKSDAPHRKSSHKKTSSNIPPAPPVSQDNPPERFFQDLDTANTSSDSNVNDNTTTAASEGLTQDAGTTFKGSDFSSSSPVLPTQKMDVETEFPALPSQQDKPFVEPSSAIANDNKDISSDVSSKPGWSSAANDDTERDGDKKPASSSLVTPAKSYASVVAQGDASHSESSVPSTDNHIHQKSSELSSGSRNRSEDVEPNVIKDQYRDFSTSK